MNKLLFVIDRNAFLGRHWRFAAKVWKSEKTHRCSDILIKPQ